MLIAEISQLERKTYEAKIAARLNPSKVQTVETTKLTDSDLKERRDCLKLRLEAGYDTAAREAVVWEPYRDRIPADASR